MGCPPERVQEPKRLADTEDEHVFRGRERDARYELTEQQFSDDAIIEEIEAKIKEVETVQVRTMVSSKGEWGEHQPLVDRLRQALLTDYPDVLADEIGPNPPVRGDKCEARIYLKEA